ncbi:erythromycin esterase family protein [Dictyobacter aurantiacus]|uniref:Erythromycin esterase n=1 Tax=Dictyobacter aurantiacus TaxID=1936993 RepID=A0A401ZCI1_9CHLR|nr:erythromycin esterase family protein [Dictyobacter aurantiacus]GCE04408.1 hypothetical protein KDAU_17370 [Dictyobacter aurantiacus]
MQEQHVTELEEVINWLKGYAKPFSSTQPGGDTRDLKPFMDFVGSARILACGEATHGTHEFFTLKHRLLELLVQEKGFTLFAIEEGWVEAQRINEFVCYGHGDPLRLLDGLRFWTWKTQEMLDIILWMRAYNERRGSAPAIQFCGIDMQSYDLAMQNVLNFVQQVDPDSVEEMHELYGTFWEYADQPGRYSEETAQVKQTCQLQLQRVYDLLNQRRPIYERLSSAREFEYALHGARIVIQAEEMFASFNYELRDCFMAENAIWHADQAGPDAKMFIWTHNGHAAAPLGNEQRRFMGTYLSEHYQEDFLTIAMLFYQGSCNALHRLHPRVPLSLPVGLPPRDSYEYAFHAVGLPRMMIDLQGFPDSETRSAWLLQSHLYRAIGAMYAPEQDSSYWSLIELAYEFDFIFYLNDSTPSRLIHNSHLQTGETPKIHTLISTRPRNGNFAAGLAYWLYNTPRGHECGVETTQAHSGDACAYLKSLEEDPLVFSTLHQLIGATAYHNQRIRLSAYIMAKQVKSAAGLWMRIEGPGGSLRFDGMYDRPITGSNDWKRYEVVLDVPEDSTQIVFGLYLSGRGQLWFDDVELESVSTNVPTTDISY